MGVIITNCAKVTSALSATSTVALKVLGVSVGRPKMKEPSTCTPCFAEGLELLDEAIAGVVEVLINGLETFRV